MAASGQSRARAGLQRHRQRRRCYSGEVLHQFDLFIGERTDLLAEDGDSTDQIVVLEHGHEHKTPNTRKLDPGDRPCFAVEICLIRREIDDMDYLLGLDHAAEEAGGRACAPRPKLTVYCAR